MNINERIIAKMKELGMKQVDLARRTGATKGAVNQWYKGMTAPSGENLVKVAQALGVTPEWLQEGKETREPVGVKYGHLTVIDGGGGVSDAHKVLAVDGDEEMLIRFLRMMTDEQRQETLESAKKIHDHNQAIVEKLTGKKRA